MESYDDKEQLKQATKSVLPLRTQMAWASGYIDANFRY